jgi:hypothetical protein
MFHLLIFLCVCLVACYTQWVCAAFSSFIISWVFFHMIKKYAKTFLFPEYYYLTILLAHV